MKQHLTVQADYRKAQIPIDDIAYITVDGRKTKITRSDGSFICTNRSLKDVYAMLPEELFTNINRGIVVSIRYVQNDRNGIVTMKDGTQFRRRVRSDRAPKRPSPPRQSAAPVHTPCPTITLSQWLDAMPLPILTMELVYGPNGGVDFLVRYCNEEMARLAEHSADDMLNQSVRQYNGVGNDKWMAIFADVAINGSNRVIEDVLDGSKRFFQLSCYQPQPGYCTCILTDMTKQHNLVQQLFRQN